MTERDTMEFHDFRVVTSNSVYRKGSSAGAQVIASSSMSQSSNRYRYTLGEVLSLNISLDVNVGAGWTRIRLKEVPKFIVHAFNMIAKFGMEVDGIFRKEGNSARLNRAEVQTIYKGHVDIPADYTVIDVCTMVKRFLRDLKPPLLDSDEFRQRLLKRACQARISNCFVLTRDEMADMCYAEEAPLLSDIHFSTLGYVMRQLSRISAHSDQHKMSTENLAVVLVGSVFGDGIHNPKKSGGAAQMRRGSQDDILAQKKQDMNVHVAAVKLLITNANLIGVRRDPYVTSNAMLRSSSAMPRCMSSGYETGSSDADFAVATAPQIKSDAPSSSSGIHRRDSEAAHKVVTDRKKEQIGQKKKRSASFLPSFRDIRHRLSNMKRAKSPSPERLTTGHQHQHTSASSSATSATSESAPAEVQSHRKKVARNESNGSNNSGRQSRSQQSRRGNTNAAKPIAKLFEQSEQPVSSGALRRLSASDQNAKNQEQPMSVAEFLLSEHEKGKKEEKKTIQKRNTMILGDQKRSSAETKRRHTAPINNNRLRRNRPNTVGAGLPSQHQEKIRNDSLEEKENQADCETDDTLEMLAEQQPCLLEQKAMEARARRAARKMVKEQKEQQKEKEPRNLNLEKKQFCDMATSPMVVGETPKKASSPRENGHAWVGTKQVITVTPSPGIVRRQSRARLSYSKATSDAPMEMPTTTATAKSAREASPLMSPVLRHTTVTNNSPPAQVVTTPRTSITPKSHVLSPLVLKNEQAPPPVPTHSPPHLTPQTSKSSLRRAPTPPSHPKMANASTPKLAIRSVTIDNGFELPDPPPALFKLPQLPKKLSAGQMSPLARQPASLSAISATNRREHLRETKSIEVAPTEPIRSAPAHGQMSPRSSEYFEFGKYTNVLRSAKDEFALPSRKQSVEPRPSVAIIRSNNCGLVRSRVNHFQEIEQLQRNETSLSGRISALSQTSLRSSTDTHPSSSDRFSDVSESLESASHSTMMSPSTPTIGSIGSSSSTKIGAATPVHQHHHF